MTKASALASRFVPCEIWGLLCRYFTQLPHVEPNRIMWKKSSHGKNSFGTPEIAMMRCSWPLSETLSPTPKQTHTHTHCVYIHVTKARAARWSFPSWNNFRLWGEARCQMHAWEAFNFLRIRFHFSVVSRLQSWLLISVRFNSIKMLPMTIVTCMSCPIWPCNKLGHASKRQTIQWT